MGYQVVFTKSATADVAGSPHVEVVQVSHDEASGATYLQSRVRNGGDVPVSLKKVRFTVTYADGEAQTVETDCDGADAALAAAASLDVRPLPLRRSDVKDVQTTVEFAAQTPPAPEAAVCVCSPLGMPPAPVTPFEPVPAPTGTPTAPDAPSAGMPAAPAAAQTPSAPAKKRSMGMVVGVVAAVALIALALIVFGDVLNEDSPSLQAGLTGAQDSHVSEADPMMGHWVVVGIEVDGEMSVDGENTYIDKRENHLDVYEDGTLELTLNGDTTTGSWENDETLQESDDDEANAYYRMEMLNAPFVALLDTDGDPVTLIAMAEEMDGYSMFLKRE